ncbi:DUF2780 domain-containing protein [Gloeobacter kilaueensis]|uniref:DUF937 domain-containing protein n=1 Tax=Gloeobacter kilaueensis (strain ATCC BAA-2537 / CCAP 1431/1 / ULC 316 / JS1) TaxID=1183438 RepID=U5QJG3_GLOK1|nr:DUF2780 domain-containing protein [Gloeobacter kilaueensis]AGY59056.1 hypothetical protein GKIL_2810 [Gloeobacter kilaueensis JS1]
MVSGTGNASSPGAQLIAQLAERLGIPHDLAAAAAGVALQFLSRQLEAGTFNEILDHIPLARTWLGQAVQGEQQAQATNPLAGLLGQVAGSLGGNLGSTAQLLAQLNQVGLSPETIGQFLPTFAGLLQQHLPPHLAEPAAQKLQTS